MIMKGVAIATGDATTVETASELDLDANEHAPQCLPAGRGTAVVTNDHEKRSHCRRCRYTVSTAAELNLDAKEPAATVSVKRQARSIRRIAPVVRH